MRGNRSMKDKVVAKTLRISFLLRNAYNVNTVLYGLKQITIIKKLIPPTIYGEDGLKIFINVIAAFYEVVKAFAGKLFYIAIMVFLLPFLNKNLAGAETYVHIIFMLTIVGVMFNTFIFNGTRSDYYAVVLMRMNAKAYVLVKYGYELAKVFMGFLIFGCIFGGILHVPIYINVLIPFFVVGAKMVYVAVMLGRYEKNNMVTNENKLEGLKVILAIILLAAAYGLPFLGLDIPTNAIVICMIVAIALGIVSARRICTFDGYRILYGRLLKDMNNQLEESKNVTLNNTRNIIELDSNAVDEKLSKKSGYEYLNALFIKRHRRLLTKPILIASAICLVIMLVLNGVVIFYPDGRKEIASTLMTSLSVSLFWMYIINRGSGYTQALFMNCDHSLLTYPFYRKPKAILKLFAIRLREIIKINLLPAAILGLGLASTLYFSGEVDSVFTYMMVIVTMLSESVFFSVHYLVIYYLLQPYNAGTEVKSGMYKVITGLTYYVCYLTIDLHMPADIFCGVMTIFAVLYCIIGCILVYKIAPRTFKIRA